MKNKPGKSYRLRLFRNGTVNSIADAQTRWAKELLCLRLRWLVPTFDSQGLLWRVIPPVEEIRVTYEPTKQEIYR